MFHSRKAEDIACFFVPTTLIMPTFGGGGHDFERAVILRTEVCVELQELCGINSQY